MKGVVLKSATVAAMVAGYAQLAYQPSAAQWSKS